MSILGRHVPSIRHGSRSAHIQQRLERLLWLAITTTARLGQCGEQDVVEFEPDIVGRKITFGYPC